jgi:hypothetical protein
MSDKQQPEAASDSPTTQTFTLRKTILYSLLPAVILFGGLESCARLYELWHPPLTLDYGWGFNEGSRIFIPSGIQRNRMTTRPEKLVSFARQSFSMPKKDNTFRICILGGSNVNYMQLNLLNLSKRLASRIEKKKQVEIINCGGLAYGSERLRIMTQELLLYDIDLILIYAGHNEFEELIHKNLTDLNTLAIQKTAYSLAMLRTIRDIGASLQLTFINPGKLRDSLPPEVDWSTGVYEFSQEELAAHMNRYRENLGEIVDSFQSHNIPIIISTVATNYWAPRLHPTQKNIEDEIAALYAQGLYEQGMNTAREILVRSPRHQASDVENTIIRDIADSYHLTLIEGEQLIIDAEPHGVPGETLMSDSCHLTHAGREIVLAAFEEEIFKRLSQL